MPPNSASTTNSLVGLPDEVLILILSFLFMSSTVPRYQLQDLWDIFRLRRAPYDCTAVFLVCRKLRETARAAWYQHVQIRVQDPGDVYLITGGAQVNPPAASLHVGLGRLRYLDLAPRPFGILVQHAEHVNGWIRLATMLPELRRLVIRPFRYQILFRSVPHCASSISHQCGHR